jgi:type II secretory pathway component GspD/PulD (secretin)
MASKKGIVITIIILAAITAGSFLFWMIPQETQISLTVSDYENYLDGVKEIHSILDQTISTEFQNLKDENISPDDYLQIADITSTQVSSQISEFVTSKPPNEWQDSYISYMDALRNFNSYVTETKVYANLVKEGKTDQFEETLTKIQSYKSESETLIELSDKSRPK